jgi:hypothetical protein
MKFIIFAFLLLSSCSSSLSVHEYNQTTQRQRMERHDKKSKNEMIKHRKKHSPRSKAKRFKKQRKFI